MKKTLEAYLCNEVHGIGWDSRRVFCPVFNGGCWVNYFVNYGNKNTFESVVVDNSILFEKQVLDEEVEISRFRDYSLIISTEEKDWLGIQITNFFSGTSERFWIFAVAFNSKIEITDFKGLPYYYRRRILHDYFHALKGERRIFYFPIPEKLQQIEYLDKKIIGYKYLEKGDRGYYSPIMKTIWKNGEMHEVKELPFEGKIGIHSAKNPYYYNLSQYSVSSSYVESANGFKKNTLVRVELGGKIIESEFGFRSEYAKIIGEFDLYMSEFLRFCSDLL